ncbi:arsenate reductase family protein [Arenibacter certesii]|uniref:Arsenate reductase n=1 Tax=Arenibacter certesii TaxID=228955 RepID=A0A918IPY4_9FLAO|nr:ArsC/Spx/MgsR family protein [Arenibacter certesii]GGW25145.1 arsenate reductase [Arenibacter certesii]
MKKIYHLSTCDTCKRILKELDPGMDFELQDIKTDAITPDQLSQMAQLAGSYEKLFSKRARLYKERNLKEQSLSEQDYKDLILEHYTFLKRPVILIDNHIFVGNSKAEVAAAKAKINS